MGIRNPTTPELTRILRETRTVAVVGASDNPARPSNDVFDYLARSSHYELYPVNPHVSGGRRYQGLSAALPTCRWFPIWSTSFAATTISPRFCGRRWS